MFKSFVFFFSFTTLTFSVILGDSELINDTFPSWFRFGTGTSAYQIEGGWDLDGKGLNVWDVYTHNNPELIVDNSTGDIACDSYHKWKEDVALTAYLGVDFYRFSISWARILPDGYPNHINEAGVRYYNNLINELIANNVTPVVTMYHWDLPQALQDIGGWPNPLLADFFVDYARVLFQLFGDRVKSWITFNEPKYICVFGYGTSFFAPGNVNQSGFADYLCGHTILKAHARVYYMYKQEFNHLHNGEIAIILDTPWYEPASNATEDLEAAFVALEFSLGWFMNPIFSNSGNYPQVMIDHIGRRSFHQGFPRSRLPFFTPDEIEFIKDTADFVGINIYTSALVSSKEIEEILEISYFADIGVDTFQPFEWKNSSNPSNKVTPWAARRLLNYIKLYYGDCPIVITENGYGDVGELNDYDRIQYFKEYLNAIYLAITEDNVDVRGYTAWSLLDSFEWIFGYTQKYGLIGVDFNDPNRTRAIKNSARFYRRLTESKSINWNDFGDE